MRERTEKEQAGNHRSFELRATTRARTQENFRKLGEWDRTRSRRNIFDNGYFYFLREAGGGVGWTERTKSKEGETLRESSHNYEIHGDPSRDAKRKRTWCSRCLETNHGYVQMQNRKKRTE